MPSIVFIGAGETRTVVETPAGTSIRDAGVAAHVAGLIGDCGGFCNCGTCHVFVDEAWLARLPDLSETEAVMLEGTATPARSNSRLSCQLVMSEDLDGIVLRLPGRQI